MHLVDIQPLIPANVHQPLIPAVLGHNARERAENGGTTQNGYLSNHKEVCRCDFRPHV